jgi:hypothetical protein
MHISTKLQEASNIHIVRCTLPLNLDSAKMAISSPLLGKEWVKGNLRPFFTLLIFEMDKAMMKHSLHHHGYK